MIYVCVCVFFFFSGFRVVGLGLHAAWKSGEEEGEVSRSTKALLCEVSVLLHRQVPEPPES